MIRYIFCPLFPLLLVDELNRTQLFWNLLSQFQRIGTSASPPKYPLSFLIPRWPSSMPQLQSLTASRVGQTAQSTYREFMFLRHLLRCPRGHSQKHSCVFCSTICTPRLWHSYQMAYLLGSSKPKYSPTKSCHVYSVLSQSQLQHRHPSEQELPSSKSERLHQKEVGNLQQSPKHSCTIIGMTQTWIFWSPSPSPMAMTGRRECVIESKCMVQWNSQHIFDSKNCHNLKYPANLVALVVLMKWMWSAEKSSVFGAPPLYRMICYLLFPNHG